MKKGKELFRHFLPPDTYGGWALAALAVVILSGVVVAVPYDPARPLASVTAMMVRQPAAAWARNLHYWSAQVFLVLVLLHMWDELRQDDEKNLQAGVWWRLILALPFLLFAMLSGFILKGDADSVQAHHILSDLLRRLPLAGDTLAWFFLGDANNLQILYLQHLVVTTLIVLFVTAEHGRRLLPAPTTFATAALTLLLLALFFPAPLHDPHDPVLKGPWYFVGLQELLHSMSHPARIWWWLPALLLLTGGVWHLRPRSAGVIKRVLLLLVGVYALLTVTGLFFRGEAWRWRWPPAGDEGRVVVLPTGGLARSLVTPPRTPSGVGAASRDEGCLLCHAAMQGFSPSHDPRAIGCSSCHLGNPYTPDKKAAHHGMVLVPGNLQNSKKSCGTTACHDEHTDRVSKSLMSSLSGMIAVDKYVFGERDDPDGRYHVDDLKKKKKLTAAESHLQTLCVSCHLGRRKEEPAPVDEVHRGGGCTACHLNHSDTTWREWQRYVAGGRPDTLFPATHPALTLDIGDEHCFSCHSRSGRIATNYEGWHETFLTAAEMPDTIHYRLLGDGRVFSRKSDDVHHAAGMECIDCHTYYELMGDGKSYPHEEEQTRIRCEDCHTSRPPSLIARDRLDGELAEVTELRHLEEDTFVLGARSATPLLNLLRTDSGMVLRTKATGRVLPLRPPAAACGRDSVHGDVSCSACHTAWAPTCIGCHTAYEPRTRGFDMLHGDRPLQGTWVEYAGVMNADPPTLGVRRRHGQREIVPAIPGMVLTVDTGSYPRGTPHDTLFRRLFAPTEPHTIAARGRSCRSCHNNPQSLGYGKGSLHYDTAGGKGRWSFTPDYAPVPYDGLPEDAWIPFLGKRNGTVATRSNFRPFTPDEQRRILTVGACLTCHKEDSQVMIRSLTEWKKVLEERSEKCVVPEWEW